MSRVLIAPFCAAVSAPAFAQAAYFAEVEDLPMPPDFSAEAATGEVTAVDGSRLVIMQASGPGSPTSVRDFYLAALPALGWAFSPGGDALVFRRGRERLTLDITAEGQGSRLRVELVQRPSPSD